MRYIVMCGGSGTRLKDYSLPKPLNFIEGKPAIVYVLENFMGKVKRLDFIVAPHLRDYQFQSFIQAHFQDIDCRFHDLPYFTRGPIETAWLGTRDLDMDLSRNEDIVFLDNDILHTFDPERLDVEMKNKNFLGYSIDKSNSEAFSFIELDARMRCTQIQEKKRISNHFVCGVYGFASLQTFRNAVKPLLEKNQKGELYMSMAYQELLRCNEPVYGFYCNMPVHHIGSLEEVKKNKPYLPKKKLRICFDLDNTLVSAPTVGWDYATVKPIWNMIHLLKEMKACGHTIIIYTARKMKTFQNNLGAVTKSCAKSVIENLETFDIPYDELIFGKPLADIYIDDKAFNPYMQNIREFGFFRNSEGNDMVEDRNKPLNWIEPNRFHQIYVEENVLVKKGNMLEGEIFYYQNLPSGMQHFFPKMLKAEKNELHLEYVKGIPFAYLLQAEMLTEEHICQALDFLERLHSTKNNKYLLPSRTQVKQNYGKKLKERFDVYHALYEIMPNFEKIKNKTLQFFEQYEKSDFVVREYIHGDFWFSNILLSFQGDLKMIDMKGKCGQMVSTGGDPMYDYAKFYQSLWGYDLILYGVEKVGKGYLETMRNFFEEKMKDKGVKLEVLKKLTFCLIIGTLPFINENEKDDDKKCLRVWNWALINAF